jgi:hypothetical protein
MRSSRTQWSMKIQTFWFWTEWESASRALSVSLPAFNKTIFDSDGDCDTDSEKLGWYSIFEAAGIFSSGRPG